MKISSISSRYWRGDQHALMKLLKKEITVPYTEFDGCLYSIRNPGKPLFVAHMDTVGVCDMSKPLKFRNNKIVRQNSGLGADDRAGINLIMNHYKDLNFLFTRDEETGRKGAASIAKDEQFKAKLATVSCVVQLDCAGHKIVRGAKHGYCQSDMMEDLTKIIPDIKDSIGSFSDLDEFTDTKAGINLSVGYYKQHSKKEYLTITEYTFVNHIIPELNSGLLKDYKPPVKKVVKSYKWNQKETGNTSGYIPAKFGFYLDGIYFPYNDSGKAFPAAETKVKKDKDKKDKKKRAKVKKAYRDAYLDNYTYLDDDNELEINLEPETCECCGIKSTNLTLVKIVGMYLCGVCLEDLRTEVKTFKEENYEV